MKQPIGTLDEAALAMHELYLSYLRAGFSKQQAMEIVIAMATTHVQAARGGGSNATEEGS